MCGLAKHVEFEKPIGFLKFLELEEYLSNLIGRKVDLVSKKALKPHIGKYILKEVVTASIGSEDRAYLRLQSVWLNIST